jgi:UDP-glucose 4-epimerase
MLGFNHLELDHYAGRDQRAPRDRIRRLGRGPPLVSAPHRTQTGEWTLVTGGAGFIGSELVAQLLQSTNRRMRVLDNLETGSRENLAEPLDSGRCELLVGDVRDDATLRVALDRVTDVFHLACLGLRRSLVDPEESHDVNATGTLRLLIAAKRAGVRRFLHVSSSEVYGSFRDSKESQIGVRGMDEDHPTRPTTVYGAAKLAGESYARAFHLTNGLPVTIVRPFNAYGPRSHQEGNAGEVIPRMMVRALAGQPLVVFGDGRQSRDFTHVRDVARGLRLAAACDEAVGETFNLGSGKEFAIVELAHEIKALCARPDLPDMTIVHEPARPGDVRRLLADASRARHILGWEPEVEWGQGLAELKKWIEAARKTPQELFLLQEGSPSWNRFVHTESPCA